VKRIVVVALLTLSYSAYQGVAACEDRAPTAQEEALSNAEKALPTDTKQRFYKLSEVAAAAFDAGDYDKAETYANELLSDANRYQTDWNYGNAIFYGNLINGRVALKRDKNVSQAESYLLAAGRTPGSPQLMSFGPNMSLAKDLLSAGETSTVVDFLDECGKFWKMGGDRLNDWKKTIESGGTPDFGSNLNYR
jgi:hypothetical protein